MYFVTMSADLSSTTERQARLSGSTSVSKRLHAQRSLQSGCAVLVSNNLSFLELSAFAVYTRKSPHSASYNCVFVVIPVFHLQCLNHAVHFLSSPFLHQNWVQLFLLSQPPARQPQQPQSPTLCTFSLVARASSRISQFSSAALPRPPRRLPPLSSSCDRWGFVLSFS